MAKYLFIVFITLSVSGCASYDYPSNVKVGESLLSFEGASLSGTEYTLPKAFEGQQTLLLFGYVHDAQFDIDRWLIGLDQVKAQVAVYEIPAIQGFIPRLFAKQFDDGMREGIPRELWRDVITVYADGDKVQRYTGNQSPKNSRVILIDKNGVVEHFYDRGFSVAALNDVVDKL